LKVEGVVIIARGRHIEHDVAELLYDMIGLGIQGAPANMVESYLFHVAVIIDDVHD
jgi:hypothetical protein